MSESDYETVRDAVLDTFNPPDDDAAEPAIMAEAIERAGRFIETVQCLCDRPHPDHPDDKLHEWEGACDRCKVLGRVQDRVDSR